MAAMPDWFVFTSTAELGNAVLVARKAMGLTQTGLAAKARVGTRFIHDLERGKGTVRVEKVIAVLAALRLISVIVPAEIESMLRGA
jgi:HTH-type transcriptional regulator / antitoxin HipB